MRGISVEAREIAVPLGLLLVVGCMIIPLPPAVLDVLLCSNLLFALLLVIGALIGLVRPFQMSAQQSLPSVLVAPRLLARAVARGLERDRDDIFVGKARLLPFMNRLAPGVLAHALRET